MPKITLEALNKAVAAWPSASDICWALSFRDHGSHTQPVAQVDDHFGVDRPVNHTRHRAAERVARGEAPCRSVATTMDEDLTSAKACTPTPKVCALSCVTMATSGPRAQREFDFVVDGSSLDRGHRAQILIACAGLHAHAPDQTVVFAELAIRGFAGVAQVLADLRHELPVRLLDDAVVLNQKPTAFRSIGCRHRLFHQPCDQRLSGQVCSWCRWRPTRPLKLMPTALAAWVMDPVSAIWASRFMRAGPRGFRPTAHQTEPCNTSELSGSFHRGSCSSR